MVSAIARLEAKSAISKLRRMGGIASDEAVFATQAIDSEIARLVEQPLLPQVLESASEFVDRYELRTLDAIQLSSAVIARELLRSVDMRFVASDKALLSAAEAEGFLTWDPSASAAETI